MEHENTQESPEHVLEPVTEVKSEDLNEQEVLLLKKLSEQHKDLLRDKAQEPISFKDYIGNKVATYKRLQEKQVSRIKSEIPKETPEAQRAIIMATAYVYAEDIGRLENVLNSL